MRNSLSSRRRRIEALEQVKPALSERPGAGEQALLQDFRSEGRGGAVRVRALHCRLLECLAEVSKRPQESAFLRSKPQYGQRIDVSIGEASRLAERDVRPIDFALESTDDALANARAVLGVKLGLAREANGIEGLEQAGK